MIRSDPPRQARRDLVACGRRWPRPSPRALGPGIQGLPPAVQRQGPDRLGHARDKSLFTVEDGEIVGRTGDGQAQEERVPGDRQAVRRLRAQGQGEDPQWQLGHPVPQQAARTTASSPARRPTWPTATGACSTRSGAAASSSATPRTRPMPWSRRATGTSSSITAKGYARHDRLQRHPHHRPRGPRVRQGGDHRAADPRLARADGSALQGFRDCGTLKNERQSRDAKTVVYRKTPCIEIVPCPRNHPCLPTGSIGPVGRPSSR